MKLLIRLNDTRKLGKLVIVREIEHFVDIDEVFLLNEHGDITIGSGRKARTYPSTEIVSIHYI
jgi:hypothetical protein